MICLEYHFTIDCYFMNYENILMKPNDCHKHITVMLILSGSCTVTDMELLSTHFQINSADK